MAVAAHPAAALDAGGIQLPVWTKALGWFGIAGLIYLLICAVSIISRGFAGLGGDAAHSMFAFAANPWVGLSVGVLGTVLIQSSTTTTAIAVTAVAQARCWRDMCRGYREPGRPRSTVQEPAIEGPGLHTRPDDALRTGAGVRACSHHASPARSRV